MPGARVDPQHDAGIEHRHEGVEIAAARRGEERVDHLSLAGQIGVGLYAGALHAASGPAG